MESINYRIRNRKREHSFEIRKILIAFKTTKEYEDYHVYHYRFSTCFFKFISKKIPGINPLLGWQYDKIEEKIKSKQKKQTVSVMKSCLDNWFKKAPEPSARLRNLLIMICCADWNKTGMDIHPLKLSKKYFLSQKNAGLKSWEEFEKLRNSTTRNR